MDSQSSLGAVAGIAALVQGLAVLAAESPPVAASRRELIDELGYRAARHGLETELPAPGGALPARELVKAAVAAVRPHLAAVGADAPLEEVERLLPSGGGAARQRRAHRQGGMEGLLSFLARDTAAPLGLNGVSRPPRRVDGGPGSALGSPA